MYHMSCAVRTATQKVTRVYKWPKMHKQTDKSISFGNAGNHVAQLVTHPPSPLSKIRPGPKMPRSLCLRQGVWMQQLKKRCT